MSRSKRIWSEQELTIAYYIARWDYAGLKISEHDMVEFIIGDTTINSLNMQVANFRFLLGIDGYQLSHTSKTMRALVDSLSRKTIVQIRRMVLDYIFSKGEYESVVGKKVKNEAASKKERELNRQYQINFEKELARRTMGRSLVRKIN